jgi:hypothetical protein
MRDKEKFDSLKSLADFRLSRHFSRANAEWKISVSLWALLALAPTQVQTKVNLCVLAIGLFAMFVGYAVFWARPISIRNREDQDTAFYYAEKAEQILDADIVPRERPEQKQWMKPFEGWGKYLSDTRIGENWGASFQILTTAFFCLVSFVLFAAKG